MRSAPQIRLSGFPWIVRCLGLPFALLEAVEGRTEDTLTLRGGHGSVRVHPIVFHTALETLAPNGWQVEQQPNRLTVRLVAPAGDTELARRRVQDALADLTVEAIAVEVVCVTELERTRLGKIHLVKALPA